MPQSIHHITPKPTENKKKNPRIQITEGVGRLTVHAHVRS